jgi:hypothetical protein
MAVELVLGQVIGGEQVPDPVRASVGRPAPRARPAIGVLVPAAEFGPLPALVRLEVERPELVHAEDGFGLAFFGDDLTVGDRVQVLNACLLDRVVRIAGGLPGL